MPGADARPPDRRPPDRLRSGATREQWQPLGALLGVDWPGTAHAAALLDPRGLRFQRLEWVGDSVLDVLGALHVVTSPCCARVADLASDASLGGRAGGASWVEHLDWDPGRERRADWLEAAVAVAHAAGGWPGARAAAAAVVHPPLAGVPLDGGASPLSPQAEACGLVRAEAAVGAAVCEAAVSLALLVRRPAADEGALSTERGALLAAARVAGTVEQAAACTGVEHRADHVQALVGGAALREGVAAAVALAGRLLG